MVWPMHATWRDDFAADWKFGNELSAAPVGWGGCDADTQHGDHSFTPEYAHHVGCTVEDVRIAQLE